MPFDIKPGRGSERIKAWVYAVMNPLIDSFRRETELLKIGDLSWRVHSRHCEYIRPVAELIDFDQRPNLEDFLAENPTFRQRFAEHDSVIIEVEQTTTLFVRDLLASPKFQERVTQCLKDYESSERSSHPTYPDLSDNLSGLPSRIPDHLAEFREPHDVLAYALYSLPFLGCVCWKIQRFFFQLHAIPSGQRGQKLMTISENLRIDLESLRLALCREYDIPAAPIEPPRSPSVENVSFR